MRQFNLACCLRPNIFELKLPASAGSPSAAFLIAAFPRASSHRLRSICWLIRKPDALVMSVDVLIPLIALRSFKSSIKAPNTD